MNKSVVDSYVNKRVSNIMETISVLMRGVYRRDPTNFKIIKNCIHKYINDFELGNESYEKLEEDNKEFFFNNKIKDNPQKRLFIILLNEITNNKDPVRDTKFIDNISEYSEIISIALELEQQLISFVEIDIGIKNAISMIRNKYKPFICKDIELNLKVSNYELKKVISKNIKTNQEFINTIKENPFYLEYYKVCDDEGPPGTIYEVKLKNRSKELNKFNSKRLEMISSEKSILYESTNILIELTLLKIMEMLFKENKLKMFSIRLHSEFVKKKSNISYLTNLTKNSLVREKLCFKIDFGEVEKNHDAILKIKNSNYKIAVDTKGERVTLTDNLKQIANCIFVSSNDPNDYKELKEDCNNSGVILLERDVGKEDVILEL